MQVELGALFKRRYVGRHLIELDSAQTERTVLCDDVDEDVTVMPPFGLACNDSNLAVLFTMAADVKDNASRCFRDRHPPIKPACSSLPAMEANCEA